MNQFVWVFVGSPRKWQMVGKARAGQSVDHIVFGQPSGTVFSITLGGLVVFSGQLGPATV